MCLLLGAGKVYVAVDFPPLLIDALVVVEFEERVSLLVGELPVVVFIFLFMRVVYIYMLVRAKLHGY